MQYLIGGGLILTGILCLGVAYHNNGQTLLDRFAQIHAKRAGSSSSGVKSEPVPGIREGQTR